jgi:hypothetical protein
LLDSGKQPYQRTEPQEQGLTTGLLVLLLLITSDVGSHPVALLLIALVYHSRRCSFYLFVCFKYPSIKIKTSQKTALK